MDTNLIELINQTDWQIYVAITDRGQTFIEKYLSSSGEKRAIKGISSPCSKQAFDRFVKVKIGDYSSEEAARKLAVAAYNEVVAYGVDKDKALGVGSVNSLDKGRVGHVHIAIHSEGKTHLAVGILASNKSKTEEERLISTWILENLCYFLNLKETCLDGDFSNEENGIFIFKYSDNQEYVDLMKGKISFVSNVLS